MTHGLRMVWHASGSVNQVHRRATFASSHLGLVGIVVLVYLMMIKPS